MIALLGASTLAGCATTQQEAARLQLNDARIRASQVPLRLGGQDQTVSVASIAVITRRHSAVIITLRNNGASPVSDLPLLVGVASGARRTELNRAANTDYFQNHVPAIPAHGSLRWVLTLDQPLPPGSVPFAKLGVAVGLTAKAIKTLPRLRVVSRGGLITVANTSGVPQYQLPVYVIAERDGRYVAAGQATIAHLGTDATTELRVPLVGDRSGATVSLEAPPTIFN
jgi:hypothetical protein